MQYIYIYIFYIIIIIKINQFICEALKTHVKKKKKNPGKNLATEGGRKQTMELLAHFPLFPSKTCQ